VLSPDVRFEGFTATDWTRVLSLFRPRPASGEMRDPERPRGCVVAVHSRGRLWKLVHTEVGRLRLDDAQRDWPLSTEELARRNHASWAIRIEAGALDSIIDRFGGRTRRGDDLVAQTLTLLELAQEEMLAGRLDLWPRRLRGVPIPAASVVRGTLDSVCPVGRAMVLGLFEHGELWTSIALRRGPRGVNLILGPDEVRAEMGLLSGDWRRDYRHLAHAVEHRLGPLAFGCYAEAATIRKLEVDASPGAWARAAAVRDLILSPLPAPLAIPLGVDATIAAVQALRAVAERVDPLGIVNPSLDRLRFFARDYAGVNVLGFHPLDVLRKLLERER
jgi:hypothetical protein